MVSCVYTGKGLVKVYWEDIQSKVEKIAPIFARLVDALSPDKSFPLYLAYYAYGDLKGDTISTFIPKENGGYYRLSDPNAPKDVIKHLGYGKASAPLAMLLEKNLELFIDLKDERITIPRIIYKPGDFFPLTRILSSKSNRVYAANNVLTLASGARSVFMLPNIGCALHHAGLQRDYNVRSAAPKSLYDHWDVFKEIAHSEVSGCHWRSCLIYFSEKWLNKINDEKAWLNLKLYLHELAWGYSEFQRNLFSYDFVFSVIQKKRNLKPNPYLVDTARHLFSTAIGASPGFVPAINNDAFPLDVIEKAYTEAYGLKKYAPACFHPKHFHFEKDKELIYYSLQNPSTHVFSPKSRRISSTISDIRELEHIVRIFVEELSKKDGVCSDTILGKISNMVEFLFYHNKTDRHRIIHSSDLIPTHDTRFNADSGFASDAKFVRGCIGIKTKHKSRG